MYMISNIKCCLWYHIQIHIYDIIDQFHMKYDFQSYMMSYTMMSYTISCAYEIILWCMISNMISYASPLQPGPGSNEVPGRFKCISVWIEMNPCSSLTSVYLSSVASRSGCGGLAVHIRHSAQCARIPLPRSPILIDLFATLLLTRSMQVWLQRVLITLYKLTLEVPSVVRVGHQRQDLGNDVGVCLRNACGAWIGASLESARKSIVPFDGPKLHVALCVMDEVLARHWGAAFPNIDSRLLHATSWLSEAEPQKQAIW